MAKLTDWALTVEATIRIVHDRKRDQWRVTIDRAIYRANEFDTQDVGIDEKGATSTASLAQFRNAVKGLWLVRNVGSPVERRDLIPSPLT